MPIPRRAIYFIVSMTLAGSSALALAAQDGARPGAAAAQQPMLTGGGLMGAAVMNAAGDRLGQVADLAISADGKVSHLVVESQLAPAGGEQLVAIPWGAARMGAAADQVMLDISRDRFASAPHFAKEDWPRMSMGGDPMRSSDSYFATGAQAADTGQVPQSQQWAESLEARDEEGGPLPKLAQMDTDGDGKVSPAEASPYERIENNFSQIDADGDGSLDEAELSAFEAQWTGSKSAPMEEIEQLNKDVPAEGGQGMSQ